jgi:hypothetical protein
MAAATAVGGTFNVTIDTSSISATDGFLAFDLLGGSPLQNNVLTITQFATNGTLGSGFGTGGFSGTLVPGPLTLNTSANFFNEWFQPITYGTTMSFQFNLTNNFSGGIADSFAFFLLNTSQIPFPSSDPTGADSAFAVDVLNPLTPAVFTSDFFTVRLAPVQQGVPEPRPEILVGLGIALTALRRRFARR